MAPVRGSTWIATPLGDGATVGAAHRTTAPITGAYVRVACGTVAMAVVAPLTAAWCRACAATLPRTPSLPRPPAAAASSPLVR